MLRHQLIEHDATFNLWCELVEGLGISTFETLSWGWWSAIQTRIHWDRAEGKERDIMLAMSAVREWQRPRVSGSGLKRGSKTVLVNQWLNFIYWSDDLQIKLLLSHTYCIYSNIPCTDMHSCTLSTFNKPHTHAACQGFSTSVLL